MKLLYSMDGKTRNVIFSSFKKQGEARFVLFAFSVSTKSYHKSNWDKRYRKLMAILSGDTGVKGKSEERIISSLFSFTLASFWGIIRYHRKDREENE